MARRVLTVGLTYAGEPIAGVEIDALGLCRPEVAQDRAAYPLYEYDIIIINPQSYSHFLFGDPTEHSNDPAELHALKASNGRYDLDDAFDRRGREREMETALTEGATVVWCLSEPKRVNFFGYRETHLGYVAPEVAALVRQADLQVRKARRIGDYNRKSPFARYIETLSRTGWTLCLAEEIDGYTSIANTPDGASLGGRVKLASTPGWILTPPTSAEAADQLVRDSVALDQTGPAHDRYHSIFLSHTSADKPFVRQLGDDLRARGVSKVWIDEAEIQIGDSLLTKIEEGMRDSRYIAVVLSRTSVEAPWVRKELEMAMTREIGSREVVVLPLLRERCELPAFLQDKLYADFTTPDTYKEGLGKLLRRLETP